MIAGRGAMLITSLNAQPFGATGILLFSGGLDSTAVGYALRQLSKEVIALSINYPGRPRREFMLARQVSKELGFLDLVEVDLVLPQRALRGEPGSPNEGWFPHRNMLFVSLAAHIAVVRRATFVAAGNVFSDRKVFTDAHHDFFSGLDALVNLARGGSASGERLDLVLPLLEEDSFVVTRPEDAKAIRKLVSRTWSCWRDSKRPCGRCAACNERRAFLQEFKNTGAL